MWYWGSGLHLIIWNRHKDGRCLGVEIERMRMLADIVAQLPSTSSDNPNLPDGRITLTDSNGVNLYQWGMYERGEKDRPMASMPLSLPLNSWRLDYYVPNSLLATPKGGLFFQLLAGLTVIGGALLILAFYFYRESSREFREAGQRVSFVNQVSHELKTPLTNIRIYSELLQQRLASEDKLSTPHLDVIVEEGERLSRLITNVLTFSSSRRGALTVHPAPARVSDIIQKVIDRFSPAFQRRNIEVRYIGESEPTVCVAADALEQIIGNLLSNVEKYAAEGGLAEINSRYEDGWSIITVADRGPGIPPRERENIFKPFYRISSALTDGVTGAGIGLAIARELARQHGGDLLLASAEAGSRFELRLRTETVAIEAAT